MVLWSAEKEYFLQFRKENLFKNTNQFTNTNKTPKKADITGWV
jgi:hypothetical protein